MILFLTRLDCFGLVDEVQIVIEIIKILYL